MTDPFKLYSTEARRKVITLLSLNEVGDEIRTEQLAEGVAGVEQEPEQAHVGLMQVHLPKFEDAGVIEYDRDEQVVTVTEETMSAASEFQGMVAATR